MNENKIKSVIILDYLKVRFKTNNQTLIKQIQTSRHIGQIKINESIKIVFNSGVKNNDYKFCDSIYFNETYIGTIYNFNKHNHKDKNSITIFFANELFYSGEWKNYYNILVKDLDLIKLNISRIDITKDIINANLLEIINKIHRNKRTKTKIKTSFENFGVEYSDIKKMDLDLVKLGNKSGSIYLKIYNKTKRLEKENKPYIKQFWFENGLIPSSKVERFELTLQKDSTKKIDIDKLNNIEYLETILQKETEKRFRIIKEQRRGKKVTSKDITPIPFFDSNKHLYIPLTKQRKQNTDIPLLSIKSMIRNLYLMYHYSDNKEVKQTHQSEIDILINEYNLKQYFTLNQKKWIK